MTNPSEKASAPRVTLPRMRAGLLRAFLASVLAIAIVVTLSVLLTRRKQATASTSSLEQGGLCTHTSVQSIIDCFATNSTNETSSTVADSTDRSSSTVEAPLSTSKPSSAPTLPPSRSPSGTPSSQPSSSPSTQLTVKPTPSPTLPPTGSPTVGTPPTLTPTGSRSLVTYMPGRLTTSRLGLLLSSGLSVRLLARSGQPAVYANGRQSSRVHTLPDFGATFIDRRSDNPGGWIYVSNSEVREPGEGGVGSFTFNANGDLIDYRLVLQGTMANCGGGTTPWGSWISCEEFQNGRLHQVDPTNRRASSVITLGKDGGLFESFAYDVRSRSAPAFFVTEDSEYGALRRFVPQSPNWQNPWSILLGSGRTDYLLLAPSSGTFRWTSNVAAGRASAAAHYPNSEGIDCLNGLLYFVSKKLQRLFILDLDAGSYKSESTRRGVFDGQPDQIQHIVGNTDERLLFFTEDGGARPGIHGRNRLGQYFTILESDMYPDDESTGLAFSPDGRHMYFALQRTGLIYDVTREDGLPFDATSINIKYHAASGDR